MNRFPRPVRRILASLAVAVSAVAVLAAASHVVMPKNNQAEFGQIDAFANGVMGEPANSIDVLFLGDSEAFSSFSPLQMWDERGIASYVCATSAQRLCYTRTLLLRALENQSPRTVALETNCIFASFGPAAAVKRTAQDIFPVFEYHDRWKSLRPEDFLGTVRHTWTDELKGFRLRKPRKVVAADATGHMAPSDAVAELPALNRLYLEDIARICREHGARLVLVSVPSTKNWSTARHNRMVQVASELGVDYHDLNTGDELVAVDWSQDTYDGGDHLNLAGAQKVSAAVGRMLSERYAAPDRRGDEAYASWDDALARYRERLAAL